MIQDLCDQELGGPSSSSFASSSASASALLARPAAAAGPSNTAAAGSLSSQPLFFGQSYARKTCVYVLRLDRAIGQHVVRWEQMPVEENAPEDIILYSYGLFLPIKTKCSHISLI
jgi:hypothetical protein